MEVNQLGEKKKLVVSMLRRFGYDLLTLNLQSDNYLFARRHRPASPRPGAACAMAAEGVRAEEGDELALGGVQALHR